MSEKLWNGTKKKANIRMSFYGRANVMQIGKDVIRVLGAPSYIAIKINPEMDSILFEAAEEKHKLSFKVPEDIYTNKNRQMTISSISFVQGLLARNELSTNETYQMTGGYSENSRLARESCCEPLVSSADKFHLSGSAIPRSVYLSQRLCL